MESILVTGGAGFIGSNLIDSLFKHHYRVICLDNFDNYYNPEVKRKNISGFLTKDNFELLDFDIRNGGLKEIIIENSVKFIFHLAARPGVRTSIKNPREYHDINVIGTLNLLQACLGTGIKKVVYTSSSSVYGRATRLPLDETHPTNPISPYAVSKLAGEKYCEVFSEMYGLEIVSLRLFTVYGPRLRPDLAISLFTQGCLSGRDIEIYGDGKKTRDFTYIDDVVEAMRISLERGKGIYNIGFGKNVSVLELAHKIIDLTGSTSRLVFLPSQTGDVEHTWADTGKARRELGWSSKIGIDEGLKKYLEWIRDQKYI